MTVREFYEHCKKIGAEDFPMFINYTYDDYYSYEVIIEKSDIQCKKTIDRNQITDTLVINI